MSGNPSPTLGQLKSSLFNYRHPSVPPPGNSEEDYQNHFALAEDTASTRKFIEGEAVRFQEWVKGSTLDNATATINGIWEAMPREEALDHFGGKYFSRYRTATLPQPV